MSAYKTQNIKFLTDIIKSDSQKRKKLIKLANKNNLSAISEIVLNLRNGNLPIHPKIRKRLQKYKSFIPQISSKKIGYNKKKRIFLQQGGLLPMLVAPFLATLGVAATDAIVKSLRL